MGKNRFYSPVRKGFENENSAENFRLLIENFLDLGLNTGLPEFWDDILLTSAPIEAWKSDLPPF